MKLAIVGSREYPSSHLVHWFVQSLNPDIEIVSGGASGVDTWAEREARRLNRTVTVFYPEWNKYQPEDPKKKNPAGMIRNRQIVGYADILAAFWDGISKGTLGSIEIAQAMGSPVYIIHPYDEMRMRDVARRINDEATS